MSFGVLSASVAPYYTTNISNNFPNDNIKNAGFNGYMFDFSVAYNGIDVSNIANIHKYLMIKHNLK